MPVRPFALKADCEGAVTGVAPQQLGRHLVAGNGVAEGDTCNGAGIGAGQEGGRTCVTVDVVPVGKVLEDRNIRLEALCFSKGFKESGTSHSVPVCAGSGNQASG